VTVLAPRCAGFLLALGALGCGTAAAAPFAGGDPEQGKAMHAKYCVACHERQYAGEEGSAIYLRPDHKVRSASGLAQQITFCTTMLKLQLFPEDELHLAAYLNSRYYKFK
jgi:cytochrome c